MKIGKITINVYRDAKSCLYAGYYRNRRLVILSRALLGKRVLAELVQETKRPMVGR